MTENKQKNKLEIILCGQRSFGIAAYRMLRARKDVSIRAVYAPSDDKLFQFVALDKGVSIRRAGTLRSDEMPGDCDLIAAAHSHDFISRAVRNRLRIGAVGYHPSLLPRHRGRDAIKWTIKMGDPVAGGTVFWLNDTVDGGPIAAQDWRFVRPDDDAGSLWERELFPLGIELLSCVLDDISNGVLVMHDQDTELATWEPSMGGAPRLFRPELLQIGAALDGFHVIK